MRLFLPFLYATMCQTTIQASSTSTQQPNGIYVLCLVKLQCSTGMPSCGRGLRSFCMIIQANALIKFAEY